MKEIEKYQKIYSQQSDKRYKRYGHSNHGKRLFDHFLTLKPESVLDVGCGHNEWAKSLKKRGVDAIGVDFACPGADINAEAHDLPFEDKQWDFVTAFDVMEHIAPEMVDETLQELSRVSRRFAFSICYADSVNRCEGETLHPCVMPEWWWMRQIANYGKPYKHGYYILGEWNQ